MKSKLIAALVGVVFLAQFANAQTSVYSANTVGYKKLTLADNKFYLMGMNFVTEGGGSPTEVFGDSLPEGSTVYVWDLTLGTYVLASMGPFGWDDNGLTLFRKGFWLYIPDYGGETYDVYLKGEVPSEAAGTILLKGNPSGMGRFTLVSLPYPISKTIGSLSGLDAVAQEGDTLYVWDGSTYLFTSRGPFGWENPNLMIDFSAGFWYLSYSTTDVNWTEVFADLIK